MPPVKQYCGLVIESDDVLAVASLRCVGDTAWLIRTSKPRGKKDCDAVLLLEQTAVLKTYNVLAKARYTGCVKITPAAFATHNDKHHLPRDILDDVVAWEFTCIEVSGTPLRAVAAGVVSQAGWLSVRDVTAALAFTPAVSATTAAGSAAPPAAEIAVVPSPMQPATATAHVAVGEVASPLSSAGSADAPAAEIAVAPSSMQPATGAATVGEPASPLAFAGSAAAPAAEIAVAPSSVQPATAAAPVGEVVSPLASAASATAPASEIAVAPSLMQTAIPDMTPCTGPPNSSSPQPTRSRADPHLTQEAAMWPKHYQDTCEENSKALNIPCEGPSVLKWIRDHLTGISLSTTFSGIESPGVAADIEAEYWDVPGGIEHLTSIENDNECLAELVIRSRAGASRGVNGGRGACVHDDVGCFLNPVLEKHVKKIQADNHEQMLEIMQPVVQSGKAVVREAKCLVHGRCSLREATIEVAGTPCQEFSSKGLGTAEHGANMLSFLIWIAIRLLLQNAIIIHENVEKFPLMLLTMFLAPFYFLDGIVLEGHRLGWPTARTRRWTVLRHKVKTMAFRCPLNVFTKIFEQTLAFSWLAYLRATDAELQSELSWASERKSSKTGGRLLTLADPDPFFNALTEQETKIVLKYRELVKASNKSGIGLCSLKQSPFPRESGDCFAHFTADDVMHTVTKNVGLLWVVGIDPERWMTPYEVLLAQCFPVYSDMFGHRHVSFAKRRSRSRNAIFEQAGNSMPISMSGLLFFYAAVAVERPTSSNFVAEMVAAKKLRSK
jgi:site-specific DNA-cytosine methylase